MYESYFGFRRRPFASTPDARWYAPTESADAALLELGRCIDETRGIAILTAPAGMGKSLLCRKLASDAQHDWAVAELPNAAFESRRSLLQAMLYALGHPYANMEENELRLELVNAAKACRPERRGVLAILDEAHLLSPAILEELRTLTNLVDRNEPLFQVVLAGQLALDETLAMPSLESFRQRIGCQATIEPYPLADSVQYLSERIEAAGARLEDVLDPDALRLISHAADGLPRCLNQLADQSLLLGFVQQQKPVGEEIVRQALEDVRQLPLHWNEPARIPAPTEPTNLAAASAATKNEQAATASGAAEVKTTKADAACSASSRDDLEGMVGFEIGSETPREAAPALEEVPSQAPASAISKEETAPARPTAIAAETVAPPASSKPDAHVVLKRPKPALPAEEAVVDRYALLDAGRPAPETEPTSPAVAAAFAGEHLEAADLGASPAQEHSNEDEAAESVRLPQPVELIDRIVPMIDAAMALDGGPAATRSTGDSRAGLRSIRGGRLAPRAEEVESVGPSVEEQIGLSVLETCLETREAIEDSRFESATPEPLLPMQEEDLRGATAGSAETVAPLPRESERLPSRLSALNDGQSPRPYSLLFSALRKKMRRAG